MYRETTGWFSHVRTFRAMLFHEIDADKEFKDSEGNFYTAAPDIAIMLPVLELACGQVHKIEGIHYLYHSNTGLNEHRSD